jgi:hypothetical protein
MWTLSGQRLQPPPCSQTELALLCWDPETMYSSCQFHERHRTVYFNSGIQSINTHSIYITFCTRMLICSIRHTQKQDLWK